MDHTPPGPTSAPAPAPAALGAMDRLIRWSITHRLIVVLASVAVLVYGVVASLRMPVDVFPDLTAPTVTIIPQAHGLAPQEVEPLFTFPIATPVNGATAPRRVRADEGTLNVGGPTESLTPRLSRWLQGEARRLLNEDLAHYCTVAEQPAPRLMLSSARRRWGSCAHDGTIRINWRLVMAPSFVRRSVVAHEVAHLVHFDHSPAFHALMGEIYEHDIRAANRWLKREGRQLYVPLG